MPTFTPDDAGRQLGLDQRQHACTREAPRMSTVLDLAAGFPPTVCMAPPSPEVLNHMADTPEDITLGELYRAISGLGSNLDRVIGLLRTEMRDAIDGLRAEFRSEIGDVKTQMGRVVFTDVFTAEQRVIAEREGAMRVQLRAAEAKADLASRLAWTCLFLLVSSIVGAIIIAVVAAVR